MRERADTMSNRLFEMPKRPKSEKPFCAGLSPEVDSWIKENKHRITVHYSRGEKCPYSAFIGNIELMAHVCNLAEQCGMVKYGNNKAEVITGLYNYIAGTGHTVEEAIKFLLSYVDEKERKLFEKKFSLDSGKEGK